jgi:acyl carrier protein
MKEIKRQVKKIVAVAVDVEPDEFGDNEHLYTDLGVDSVVGFEIIVKLQKQFKIVIDDKEAPTLMTVNKMTEVVARELGKDQNN